MSLKNVLLVDDDKANNFLNRLTIREAVNDCAVAEALNGQEALDYLAASDECPQIILLDINMPVIDGFEFLKKYEEEDTCRQSKIFMLSSSIREEDKKAALSNKFVKGYFDKPLSGAHIEEILSKVNESSQS
jgi:CheY-like chemotaxis protein